MKFGTMLDKVVLEISRVCAKLKILFMAAILHVKMPTIETEFYIKQNQRSLKSSGMFSMAFLTLFIIS